MIQRLIRKRYWFYFSVIKREVRRSSSQSAARYPIGGSCTDGVAVTANIAGNEVNDRFRTYGAARTRIIAVMVSGVPADVGSSVQCADRIDHVPSAVRCIGAPVVVRINVVSQGWRSASLDEQEAHRRVFEISRRSVSREDCSGQTTKACSGTRQHIRPCSCRVGIAVLQQHEVPIRAKAQAGKVDDGLNVARVVGAVAFNCDKISTGRDCCRRWSAQLNVLIRRVGARRIKQNFVDEERIDDGDIYSPRIRAEGVVSRVSETIRSRENCCRRIVRKATVSVQRHRAASSGWTSRDRRNVCWSAGIVSQHTRSSNIEWRALQRTVVIVNRHRWTINLMRLRVGAPGEERVATVSGRQHLASRRSQRQVAGARSGGKIAVACITTRIIDGDYYIPAGCSTTWKIHSYREVHRDHSTRS